MKHMWRFELGSLHVLSGWFVTPVTVDFFANYDMGGNDEFRNAWKILFSTKNIREPTLKVLVPKIYLPIGNQVPIFRYLLSSGKPRNLDKKKYLMNDFSPKL